MVPPPSAVMPPRRQTPAQSMLRRPAASAAVIACAASATSDSQCSTKSLVGRLHIEFLPGVDDGTYVAGSILNSPRANQLAAGTSAAAGGCLGLMEEPIMAHPDEPVRASLTDDEVRRQARLNNLDKPDPELAEGPASGGKIAM